jgi:hypothetical protein
VVADRKQVNTEYAVPDEVLKAARQLIDYLWYDELRDFLAADTKMREEHIFRELLVLIRWLGCFDPQRPPLKP